MAALHDGSARHRELLAACVALKASSAVLCALCAADAKHSCDTLAERSAMRACRAIRPNLFLKPLAGYVVILKDWGVEIAKHC
jgi:hypothetical protein